jgi:5-formyltetrahydrofolate cyclo-ligase
MPLDTTSEKRRFRESARASRHAQEDKEKTSRVIVQRLMSLPEYEAAQSVAFYVDVRDEVRTRFAIPKALNSGKQILVPFCADDQLELCRIENVHELELGRFGVLEPRSELREASRLATAADVDLIVVPGVAFDRHGGRMGHGLGYYDRLLVDVPPSTVLVGLAFECQVFHDIPVETHDVSMDWVITESTVYIGRGHEGERSKG